MLLLLLSYILSTLSQCPSLSLTPYCLSFIDYNYYNATCNTIQYETLKSLNLVLSSIESQDCRNNMAILACSYAYKNSEVSVEKNSTIFEVQKPCSSLCTNVETSCISTNDYLASQIIVKDILNVAKSLNSSATSICNNENTCNPGIKQSSTSSITYGHCEVYTGNICKGISSNIFIYPGLTQSSMEKFINQMYFMLAMAPRDNGCRDSLAKWMCGLAFPECDNTNTISIPISNTSNYLLPVVIPKLPCNDICTNYKTKCASLHSVLAYGASTSTDPTTKVMLSCLNKLLNANCSSQTIFPPTYDCSGTMINSGVLDYPISTYELSSTPLIGSTCNPMNGSYYVNYKCNTPLVDPQEMSSPTIAFNSHLIGGSCSVPCPSLVYDPSDYDNSEYLMNSLGGVSFILSSLLFLTWTVFASKRKNWLVWAVLACIFMTNIALTFTHAVPAHNGFNRGYSNMGCKNNVDPVKFDDGGYCIFQACILLYFSFAAMLWWFLQGLDLFMKIVLKLQFKGETERIKHMIFSGIGWIWPLINLIVALSLKKLGNANAGIPWCFITDDSLSMGMYYIPFCILTCINTIFICSIMCSIFISSVAVGSHKKPGWWHIHVRPFMFVFCFICVWSFIFAYRFYEFGNQDTYFNQSSQWIVCAMVTQPALAAQGINIECGVRPYPSRTLWLGVQVMVAGQGIFLAMVYTYLDNFTLWFDLLIKLLGSCGLIILNEEQKKAIVVKSKLTGTDLTDTSATNTNNDGGNHHNIELPEFVHFEGRTATKSIFLPDGRVIPSKSFAAQETAARISGISSPNGQAVRSSNAQSISGVQSAKSPNFKPLTSFQLPSGTKSPVNAVVSPASRPAGQSIFQPPGREIPSKSFAAQESHNTSLSPKQSLHGVHS